ncbi:calretinin-like isoform X3 [Amphiura filiformis]|uniref:calretinin-like isoform X3 n=1 Tax=Amphiura filiformis TaxID=82378 RepID=UPI003B21F638
MAEKTTSPFCLGKGFTADNFLKVWTHYDADGNGYIEQDELRQFFKELDEQSHGKQPPKQEEEPPQKGGKRATEEEFEAAYKEFIAHHDANADGKIEMKELAEILMPEENFLLLFRSQETLRSSVEFMEAWRKYDTDKSGYIESGELKNFLADVMLKSKQDISDSQLDEYTRVMLELFDRNGDGKLEIKEMARLLPVKENFLMQFQGIDLVEDPLGLAGEERKKVLTRCQFDEVFNHYDKDCSGTIEGDELTGFLKDLLEHEGKDVNADALELESKKLKEICDVNKDNKIQKEELVMLLAPKD